MTVAKLRMELGNTSSIKLIVVRFRFFLYEMRNPMPYEGARDMEVELGIALRPAGYGVWQA